MPATAPSRDAWLDAEVDAICALHEAHDVPRTIGRCTRAARTVARQAGIDPDFAFTPLRPHFPRFNGIEDWVPPALPLFYLMVTRHRHLFLEGRRAHVGGAAQALVGLASLLVEVGEVTRPLRLLQRAAPSLHGQDAVDIDHVHGATLRLVEARCLGAQGQWDKALPLALAAVQSLLGDGDRPTTAAQVSALITRGSLGLEAHRIREAGQDLQRAFDGLCELVDHESAAEMRRLLPHSVWDFDVSFIDMTNDLQDAAMRWRSNVDRAQPNDALAWRDDFGLLVGLSYLAGVNTGQAASTLWSVVAQGETSQDPRTAAALHGLAAAYWESDDIDSAIDKLWDALGTLERRFLHEASWSSQDRLAQLLRFWLDPQTNLIYSLAASHPEHGGAAELAFTCAALRKSRTIDIAIGRERRRLPRTESTTAAALTRELQSLRGKIARGALRSSAATAGSASKAKALATMQRRALRIEESLARLAATAVNGLDALKPRSLRRRIANQLGPHDVAIELVRHRMQVSGTLWSALYGDGPPAERYAAVTLQRDGSARFIPLGPCKPIDDAVGALLATMTDAEMAGPWRQASRTLHRLLMAPLIAALPSAIERLYLTPDGALHRLPFAALSDGKQLLADRFELTLLTSSRQLLQRRSVGSGAPRAAAVFGNPDVDHQLRTLKPPPVVTRGAGRLRTVTLGGFRNLAGAESEARAVARALDVSAVVGPQATSTAFLGVKRPRVLHAATHGKFYDDETLLSTEPLAASVLAFAGANDMSDPSAGLVTALDVLGMDLRGTELVVLSACQSALGDDHHAGEGVHGLRRAFAIAGARTIVASLWPIDDASTEELMATFYQHFLHGMAPHLALREAARTIRAQRKYAHPHHWAAFVCVGSSERGR